MDLVKLNAALDKATEFIIDKEAEWRGVGLPVNSEVAVGNRKLGFTRCRTKFRIVVSELKSGKIVYKPWTDCSRLTRIEMFPLLPDLEKAIVRCITLTAIDAERVVEETISKMQGHKKIGGTFGRSESR